MTEHALLGPWVRRFLLEHLVAERNLAANTQRSYRDTLRLLLPFAARSARKGVDRLQVEVHHLDMGHLVGARPGVVKEQQQGMIPPALGRIQRRRRQQGVHFRLLQVAHQGLGRFLERDGADFRAPRDVLRAAHADEVRQGADGRQSLVVRRRATAPFLAQLA